jgi:hypothetical protein
MPLPSFTLAGNLNDILPSVVAGEIGTVAWDRARVILTHNIKEGVLVWAGKVYNRPPTEILSVDVDGNISSVAHPVLLLANDAGLNVTGIQWNVQIESPRGTVVTDFWITAPGDGVTVDLGDDAIPVAGSTALAVPRVVTYLDNGDGTITFYVNGVAAGPPVAVEGGGGGAVSSVAGRTGAVTLTSSDVGLGNVTNTSDASKPVSTAQQTALDLKAPLASPTFTGTVSGVSKAAVGLGNVDNTADAAKAVLSASKLTTARNINGVAFDGTAAITVTDATKQTLASVQLYGSGVPSSGLGKDTDTYTDYTNAKKYTKASGAWTVTTDATVSKEVALTGGTWSITGGVLTSDSADGMTIQKVVPTLNTDCYTKYTLAAGVNMVNKMLRIPVRMDQVIDGWSYTGEMKISDSSGFTNTYTFVWNSKDILRANEVEAFICCPNTGLSSGTAPDLTSIRYFQFYNRDDGSAQRATWLGQPVLIG